MNNTTADIEKILQDETNSDLPKTNLEAFLYFDEKLKTDVDLLKKLVRIISKLVRKYCYRLLFNFSEMLHGVQY